jgi:hypothetical protein
VSRSGGVLHALHVGWCLAFWVFLPRITRGKTLETT